MDCIVATDWLAEHSRDADLRIVDTRWYLDPARSGRSAYEAGHIPGAVFVDVATELANPGGRRGGPLGRHPWPSEEQVALSMGRAGVDASTRVVAYDDQAGSVAARLWFVLRAHGHSEAAVLDGGIAKWVAEGRPLEAGVVGVAPRKFTGVLERQRIVTKEEMLRLPSGSRVVDARVSERYRGEVEPIDPRAGHIPGASNVPYTSNLTGGPIPVFLPPSTLRENYARVGAEKSEPIVYCGSGITACHDLLAMERAGLRGRLYAGSWSEWSSDPALPCATGG